MDSPLPQPVLAERYALLALLGGGATSRVFRALDLLLDRPVAVKLLRPCDDELASERLRAEAVIASALHHPGIARVFDYGEASVDGERRPYLAMELVEGRTLREELRGGPLSPEAVLRLLEQVADALAHAHRAGVVHRDVKPGNIVLTPDGRAVLLDFGIARRADLEPLTLTGMIVGTVDYLSAEQASGHSATPRSDLYSLGCVAYEALTGRRPFKRDTLMETVAAHATSEAAPLPHELPAGVRALVEQLVRRDPAERPADAETVAELARHPEQLVGDQPTEATPLAAAPVAVLRDPAPTRRQPRIRTASVLAAAAAALAAVVTAGQLAPEGSPAVAAGASTRVATPPSQAPSPTIVAAVDLHRPAGGDHRHRRAARVTKALPGPPVPTPDGTPATPTPAGTHHSSRKPAAHASKPTATLAASPASTPGSSHPRAPFAGPGKGGPTRP